MRDVADVRSLALALPEAVELDHFGNPSFRVRGKIFATWSPCENRMTCKFALPDQMALLTTDPETFSAEKHWGRFGWTRVQLAGMPAALVADLLRQSWCTAAPKSLQKTLAAIKG